MVWSKDKEKQCGFYEDGCKRKERRFTRVFHNISQRSLLNVFNDTFFFSVIANQKPSLGDSSTHPSWVKLPVETHEPNTSGAPMKESSTNGYSTTTTTSKPSTQTSQSQSDNDILVTSNNINAISSSTQYPSSTLSMLMSSTTTDSNEAGITPLNMSNYKDGKRFCVR